MAVKLDHFFSHFDYSQQPAEVVRYLAETICRYGTLHSYKKHEFIYRANEPANGIYFVRDGILKISNVTNEGVGITASLRSSGDIFGFSEILSHRPRRRFAECIYDAHLFILSVERFWEIAQAEPRIIYAVSLILNERHIQTQRFVEALLSRPIVWRLCWLLLYLCRSSNTDWDLNEVRYSLGMGHEEMARVVGCSRQTVTEIFNEWRTQGLVKYSRKEITIIDPRNFFKDVNDYV